MKVSIGIGGAASGGRRDFDEQVEYVIEAEKLGVDLEGKAQSMVEYAGQAVNVEPYEQATAGEVSESAFESGPAC